MFTDEAGILIAAAILAANRETPPMMPGHGSESSPLLASDNPVDRLAAVLKEMERQRIIGAPTLPRA